MEEKKLFLLDAYALIYRAYYALMRTPRVTSKGFNTSAIFGFVNTVDEILRKENPGYIAVCFDPAGGHTFRHEEYPEYKAGRDKQPEDITASIPYIKDILKAYRIPVVEVPRYEADDVIGTLSRLAQAEGFTTYMMTPDKDYGQLVTDRVFMYRPALKGQGFEVRGPEQVCERYGISSPRQVIDLLALEGDASDNVPGCPGVGEKTAAKLIAQFGSVENLLDNTDSLKGALQKKIIDNAAQILMSKSLVTINTSAPVDVRPDDLIRKEPDVDALLEIFRELEFKSFIQKWEANTSSPAQEERPERKKESAQPSLFDFADEQEREAEDSSRPQNVTILTSELTDAAAITGFISKAIASGTVGIAVNSVGQEAMTAESYGIALAYGNKELHSAYIPYPAEPSARAEVMTLLEPLFAAPEVTITGADIKRDMLLLRRDKVEFAGARWFDIGVAHYLCSPESRHNTASLASVYLGIDTYDAAESPSAKRKAPADPAAAMTETASVILRLKPLLENEMEQKGQRHLFDQVEQPMIEVLASMEWEGVRIDTAALGEMSRTFGNRLAALEEKAFAMAGRKFNVSSPAQVGQILFEELAIDPKAKKTKGGAWSTAEDVLEKYRKNVPLVQLILDIRGLKKLLATYIDALPRLLNPVDGKLHTTYNQTVTATGRISSSNPNLQNIPVRTDDGREIRAAFVPDPGCLMLSVDYSQIELRLMADLSGDSSMVEAFLHGEDIHRATAAKIYHLDPKDVTDDQRRNAKTANFGIIYGISAFGLSERLGIPRAEARQLIDGYLESYPGVAGYMQQSIERARTQGYVTTVMGRRRYLPDINSRSNTVRSYAERNAINAPLQGTAADIIKVAMVDIYAEMRRRGMRSRMIMQVHDELVFNVLPNEADELTELVTTLMEKAYNGRVPMSAAAGTGSNWLEAH